MSNKIVEAIDEAGKQADLDLKARELLRDPGMLYRIGRTFSTVNETDSILYIIVCTVEGESKEVRGQSSSGKGKICDEACEYLPPSWSKKITGISDKAMRHLPSQIKMLYVAERRGLKSGSADDESNAEFDMKLMISEHCLTVLTTVRDKDSETGFKTKESKIQVGSFLLTTTSELSLEEYDNRFHILNARDDTEQNRRVVESITNGAEILPWKRRSNSEMKLVCHKIFEIVDADAPKEVVIPYASQLVDSLDFSHAFIRRNIKKLLALVRSSARIHYLQRPIIRDPGEGARAVIALPEDLMMVLSIGERALRSTFNVLSESAIETLEACKDLYNSSEDITKKSVSEKIFARSKKRVSDQTAYKRLDSLVKKGYLWVEEKAIPLENGLGGKIKGKSPMSYTLVGDADLAPSLTRLVEPKKIAAYEDRVQQFLRENGVPTDKTINYEQSQVPESADLGGKGQDSSFSQSNRGGGFMNRCWVDPLKGSLEPVVGPHSSRVEEKKVCKEGKVTMPAHSDNSPDTESDTYCTRCSQSFATAEGKRHHAMEMH